MKLVAITFTRLVSFLFLTLLAMRSFSALPDGLSYQGYLTDASGVPLDATVDITFRLYNEESGGSPLWSEQKSVTVSKGLFSVELGKLSNPLPEFLFDNPVWLGVQVDTDNEMSPRKALTAVGFAFRAQRAEVDDDTLASLSCAASEVPKWDGKDWGCAADQDTSDWNALANVPAGFSDGLDSDTLGGLVCTAGQYAMFDGVSWICTSGLQASVTTLQTQVNTLASTFNKLQADISALQTNYANLQAENAALQARLQYVMVNGTERPAAGANLHKESGSGQTSAAQNGLGKLIVGYHETGTGGSASSCSLGQYTDQTACTTAGGVWAINHKRGSHNIVVGSENNNSSF